MLPRLVLDLDEAVERAGRCKLGVRALAQLGEALDLRHRALERIRFLPPGGKEAGNQKRTSDEQVERQ
jgi:hypothetical protein